MIRIMAIQWDMTAEVPDEEISDALWPLLPF
jgi:hypothetical protein